MDNEEIMTNVIRFVPPQSLGKMRTLSATFRYVMNSYDDAYIKACASTFAPGAQYIFPQQFYPQYCAKSQSTKATARYSDRPVNVKTGENVETWLGQHHPTDGESGICRYIPTVQWLKMVAYREVVAHEIVAWLAVNGHPMPVQPSVTAIKV